MDGTLPGWYPVFTDSSPNAELGMAVTMVGYGNRGQYNPTEGGWEELFGTYGTRREGLSEVDEVGGLFLKLDFDGGPEPNFAVAGSGDSGGAAFSNVGGQPHIIGVITGRNGGPYYGDTAWTGAERVSVHHQWVMGFATGFTLTHAVSVSQGIPIGTNPSWYYYSDDIRHRIDAVPPPSAATGSISFIVEGIAPIRKQDVGGLTFSIESRCTASPLTAVNQQIELWDWEAESWVVVDVRNPASSDTVVEVAAPAPLSRFVRTSDELCKARIKYFDLGVLFPAWSAETDQTRWTVTRS